MASNILSFQRPVNGVFVDQRRDDGFINATAMSKAYQAGSGQRRDVYQWLANDRTQESIRHLSLKTGIPVFKLVETKPGRYGGTWIHPRLAVRFAIWLSDEFGYLVEQWVEQWLTGRSFNSVDVEQEWIQYQQRYDIRIDLKDRLRPALMNATVAFSEVNRVNPRKLCSEVHDTMNERVQGAKADDIRKLNGLPLGELLRDYFGAEPLVQYSAINQLATNAIVDRGVHPVQAVHEACDAYLGKAYEPKIVPIAENLYSQGCRLRRAKKQRRLVQGQQLNLFSNTDAC